MEFLYTASTYKISNNALPNIQNSPTQSRSIQLINILLMRMKHAHSTPAVKLPLSHSTCFLRHTKLPHVKHNGIFVTEDAPLHTCEASAFNGHEWQLLTPATLLPLHPLQTVWEWNRHIPCHPLYGCPAQYDISSCSSLCDGGNPSGQLWQQWMILYLDAKLQYKQPSSVPCASSAAISLCASETSHLKLVSITKHLKRTVQFWIWSINLVVFSLNVQYPTWGCVRRISWHSLGLFHSASSS